MSNYDGKFKNLNLYEKEKNVLNKPNNLQKNNNESETYEAIFDKLIKNISKNNQKDRVLILLLIFMLKNKKTSNNLILALLYIFL